MSSRGATFGHDGSVIHHDQSIAQLLGLVHVVRRDDERDPLSLESIEAFPQQVPRLRVEPGGRFVEDQQFRPVDESSSDGEAAFHAPRQVVDLVVGPLGELGEIEEFGRAFAHERRGRSKYRPNISSCVEPTIRARVCPLAARRPGVRGSRGRPFRVEAEDRELPDVGCDTAEIMRMVLVLPAPFGPRNPKLSPRSMAKPTPLTASKSPKRFTSWRASRMGLDVAKLMCAFSPYLRMTSSADA